MKGAAESFRRGESPRYARPQIARAQQNRSGETPLRYARPLCIANVPTNPSVTRARIPLPGRCETSFRDARVREDAEPI